MAAIAQAQAPILNMDQGELTKRLSAVVYPFPARVLADAANTAIRTAENWVNRRSTPDALHLLRLMATVPEVQAEVRRLTAMHSDLDPHLERDLNVLVARVQQITAKREAAE